MQEIQIGSNQAGQRLDKFLHKCLPEAGSSFLYKMLRKKNIVLNGKKAEGAEILRQGDVVRMFFAEETYLKFAGAAGEAKNDGDINDHYLQAYRTLKGIAVIYEDQELVILNKPAGILTQKAKSTDLSLNEWLIGYLLETGGVDAGELRTFKPSVCNRLDRNTSGLVLCGKTLAGSQYLSELLRTREIAKFYRTICVGELREELCLEGSLHKDVNSNKVRLVERRSGQDARLIVRPLDCAGGFTLLDVELLTGKTHQIRAQLADAGHHLIGDYKYGNRTVNDRLKARYGLEYQLLHACRVILPDVSEITAPEPELFETVARGLGLSPKLSAEKER